MLVSTWSDNLTRVFRSFNGWHYVPRSALYLGFLGRLARLFPLVSNRYRFHRGCIGLLLHYISCIRLQLLCKHMGERTFDRKSLQRFGETGHCVCGIHPLRQSRAKRVPSFVFGLSVPPCPAMIVNIRLTTIKNTRSNQSRP